MMREEKTGVFREVEKHSDLESIAGRWKVVNARLGFMTETVKGDQSPGWKSTPILAKLNEGSFPFLLLVFSLSFSRPFQSAQGGT